MSTHSTRAIFRVAIAGCWTIAALYLAKAIYRGLTFTRGDFYFTMPGEYARRLNPTLWNSPDVQQALGYNHGTYFYGPTQYLTLFPVVFLPSYESIAAALLVAYPFVLAGACYVLWRLVSFDESAPAWLAAALCALVFAFLPVTQALVQREFEVVAFLALVLACLFLVRGRDVASGAAVAYLTWFKYWPILLVATFVVHRRFKAVAAFVAASAAILLAAHLAFGLGHFIIGKTVNIVGGLVRPLGGGEVLYPVIERGAQKSDFCRQWIGGRGTQADVRWALCGLEDRMPAISAKAVFYSVIAGVATLFAWGVWALERSGTAAPAKWATIWEFSILTIAGAAFVHAHYYYYIVLLLPLGALLYWYLTRPQPWRRTKITGWIAAYILVNALVLPTSWLSAWFDRDAWAWYLDSGLCVLGVLIVLTLVLYEFLHVSVATPRSLTAV